MELHSGRDGGRRGDYAQKIIGDIGYRSKKEEAAFLLGEEGTEVAVNPFKAKLGYGQKVLGYIPCEEEDGGVIYVRVIGKSWGKRF